MFALFNGSRCQKNKTHINQNFWAPKGHERRTENYANMTYLIPISVTTYDDGFYPSTHKPGDVFADNSFPEDSATQNISNGAIW